MYPRLLSLVAVGLLLCCCGRCRAVDPAPGHSLHGEAFNEGPRQKAYLMGDTGKVRLTISSKHIDAIRFFDQGVGQLHGFWYFEAERSFRQVAAIDPDCAMAFWGMAMANVNNGKRAKGFIDKATANKDKASPREQKWIAAYANFFDDKKPEKDRRRDIVKGLEDINFEFPDELEAKAFLLFHVWENTRHGIPISSKLAVDALIRDVLAKEPMHPAHHYMIHLWDEDKAARALTSAGNCGQSAPNIAHMWHMSGHIYSKVKRYGEAAWQQEASARVDHRFMMNDWVLPDQIHNYSHNNQWLVENLEYIGRVHDAIALAKNLIDLPRHPKYNTLSLNPAGTQPETNHGSAAQGRRRLLETLTRFELWNELINLADSEYVEATDMPAEQVKRQRLLGVASFATGDVAKGMQQIGALETRLAKIRTDRYAAADEAEAKAKKDKKPAAEVAKIMADTLQKFNDLKSAVDNAVAELRGWEALLRSDLENSKAHFESASDIPRDRQAHIWLQLGDKDKALKLAREELDAGEKQVCRLANYVYFLEACGKDKEAADQFAKLRELAAEADRDLPVFERLAALAKKLNLPEDWRLPAQPPTDVGIRPRLNDLGPLYWQPPHAPAWQLRCADGSEFHSDQIQGKPHIIICFLGSGCIHCVEQLKLFSGVKEQFDAAGIELLAVSADESKAGPEVPFKVLCDPELTFFKKFRAYDDFENRPLHGTYLIDETGRLRWHDISFEPFKDTTFLLAEAKRLLRTGKSPQITRSK